MAAKPNFPAQTLEEIKMMGLKEIKAANADVREYYRSQLSDGQEQRESKAEGNGGDKVIDAEDLWNNTSELIHNALFPLSNPIPGSGWTDDETITPTPWRGGDAAVTFDAVKLYQYYDAEANGYASIAMKFRYAINLMHSSGNEKEFAFAIKELKNLIAVFKRRDE